MRAQLLALSTAADLSMARRACHAYTAVSRACHHRAYDLAPNADELRAWIEEIACLVDACRDVTASDVRRCDGTERQDR